MRKRIKICSANFVTSPGDIKENVKQIKELIDYSIKRKINILSLPELSLTSASLYDGYLEENLLDEAYKGLKDLLDYSEDKDLLFTLGLPIKGKQVLSNAIFIIKSGEILALYTKKELKAYEKNIFNNFYENEGYDILGLNIVDNDYPIEVSGIKIGVSIGEEDRVRFAKTNNLVDQGADIILNPSANVSLIGAHEDIINNIKYLSKDIVYVHTSAGQGESSTDNVYSGDNIIACDGKILKDEKFNKVEIILPFDIKDSNFKFNDFTDEDYYVEKFPYLPKQEYSKKYLEEALNIQALGLYTRMKRVGTDVTVIGVSGGIDSTAALLAMVFAYDMAGIDKKNIKPITMPAFATSDRTKSNAYKLCKALGLELVEIDISNSVAAHLNDIGHDGISTDLAYENAQARMRIQVLFNLSNMNGGLVVGTGDLSENMQGFATYNGDHMSSYSINASLMKTELRYMIKSFSYFTDNKELKEVLKDILDTPVSPELKSSEDGQITQKTEDIIGPYELLDFFIYEHLTYHKKASYILEDCYMAFKDKYDKETIKKWIISYFKRFTTSQFKRSASVDGPNVTGRSFSPRLGFKIASDMSYNMYLEDLK